MSKEENSGGIGLGGVLLTVFVVLKLVGVIDWSWWWVLSPIWISLGVVSVILIIVALAIGLGKLRGD